MNTTETIDTPVTNPTLITRPARRGNGTWTYTVRYVSTTAQEVVEASRVNRAEARRLKSKLQALGYGKVWIVRDQDGAKIR